MRGTYHAIATRGLREAIVVLGEHLGARELRRRAAATEERAGRRVEARTRATRRDQLDERASALGGIGSRPAA